MDEAVDHGWRMVAEDGLTAGRWSSPEAGLYTLPGVVPREDDPLVTQHHRPLPPPEPEAGVEEVESAVVRGLGPGTEHLHTARSLSQPDTSGTPPVRRPHQGQSHPAGVPGDLP